MKFNKLIMHVCFVVFAITLISGITKGETLESETNQSVIKSEGTGYDHSQYEYGLKLTPIGAIRAGNENGTIPPWTGGITSIPEGYKKGDHHQDPFPNDKELFVINSTNVNKYSVNLSAGQIALLKKYPSFRMHVYQTRRSASFPQYVYEATINNEKTAKLHEDGNSVENSTVGIPFPVPVNGQEAIWNHILRYRGEAVLAINVQVPVTKSGDYTLLKTIDDWFFQYNNKDISAKEKHIKVFYLKQTIVAPPSIAGFIALFHEPVAMSTESRQIWVYVPGLRRVNRMPHFAYDFFPDGTEGLRTADQYIMYNGAIDRYDWDLIGRKELYVPYNAYKIHSDKLKCKDIIKPGHINTDYTRYELHRVWVVEATVKSGKKHIFPHRTFYLDEDSWQALIIDMYNKDGQLWRVSEGHVINYYEVPTLLTTLETHYDLKSGRYYIDGLDNEEKMYDFSIKRTPGDYSSAELRKMGRR
ncbi:MAG: DUF1329 domain-containing protein [Candidatus Anammoxibacter sp.]